MQTPGTWVAALWKDLRKPLLAITAHVIVSIAALLALAAAEAATRGLGLEREVIPLIGITIGEWFRLFDVVAATGINAVGILKAVRDLWKDSNNGEPGSPTVSRTAE